MTDEGIEQAKAARRYFEQEGISFTRVYSSTQERACDTAKLATGRVDYIRLKGIKEMDFGAYEAHQEYLNPPLRFMSAWSVLFVRFWKLAKKMRLCCLSARVELLCSFICMLRKIRRLLKKRPANCAIFKITYDGKEMCVQSIYNPSMQEYIFERD